MPRIWNKRDPKCPSNAVYVGRPTGWGNTYSHLQHANSKFKVATVDEAIAGYQRDLLRDIAFIPEYLEKIKAELADKDLICWCAPFGGIDYNDPRTICHAQVLARVAKGEIPS